MKPNDYFGKSKGDFPKPGVVGLETEWMDAGVIAVPHGRLWVGDLYAMGEDGGCVVRVPKGAYRVHIAGMDFKGHRRPSRVRATLAEMGQPNLDEQCGEVGTDCGVLGLCDPTAFKRIVGRKHAEQYGQDVMAATMDEIVGCIGFEYAEKTFEFAFLPSGLGDGSFKVYTLQSEGKQVGLEVELLRPGFKVGR